MVHRRVRKSHGKKALGSHNRSWIWGRHVVAETLSAGIWPIHELALSDKLDTKSKTRFHRQAAEAGISVQILDDDSLTKLCQAADHQGCAARMAEFPYAPTKAFLAGKTRIVILDRIQDPFNFGAMIRTVDGLGLDGVVIGAREQVGVNSQVARSSAGAVNHVPICRVDELAAMVAELVKARWQVWGATERGTIDLHRAAFRSPLAVVIGNEGSGLSPAILKLCTHTVRIPMAGSVSSLNAAVSAGILCYAATKSEPEA